MDFATLLADLSARFDAQREAENVYSVHELAEVECSQITLAARLLACQDESITLLLRGGERVTGIVKDVARTWVLVHSSTHEALIPVEAIVAVWSLHGTVVDEMSVAHGVRIGHVLRELSECDAEINIHHDAGVHRGYVSQVMADHFDLKVLGAASTLDSRDCPLKDAQIITFCVTGVRKIETRF